MVWVGLESDHVLVCTSDRTWKAKDMRRDPRVSMSVVDLRYTGAPVPSRGTDRRCFVIAVQQAAAHTLGFVHRPG